MTKAASFPHDELPAYNLLNSADVVIQMDLPVWFNGTEEPSC